MSEQYYPYAAAYLVVGFALAHIRGRIRGLGMSPAAIGDRWATKDPNFAAYRKRHPVAAAVLVAIMYIFQLSLWPFGVVFSKWSRRK